MRRRVGRSQPQVRRQQQVKAVSKDENDYSLMDSVYSGASMAGLEVFYSGEKNMTKVLKRSGVQSASCYVGKSMVYPMVKDMVPMQGKYKDDIGKAVVTGGIYAVSTEFIPNIDKGGLMFKFLKSVGSTYAGTMIGNFVN